MITGDRIRWAAALLSLSAIAACNVAGAKDNKKGEGKSEPAMAEDAVLGSCMAKDASFCDEYRNRQSIKDEARTVELTMTKGACESDLKNGVWREGKACEAKGEIGHCVVDKHDSFKRLGYSFKGDEDLTGAACHDLMGGKWESGMADDALIGRCVVGNSCTEIHNNKKLDADGRARGVKSEQESCERLEGAYESGKTCETAASTSKCTKKGEYRLTLFHFEAGRSKEELKDAKELCDIGGDEAKFETLTPAKK